MFDWLAALIPIAASLYVAIWALADQARLAEERRVRERVQELMRNYDESIKSSVKPRPDGGPDFDAESQALVSYERRILAFNGLRIRPTLGGQDINLSMSGPEMPVAERRRQWFLIVAAILGVFFLAIDA